MNKLIIVFFLLFIFISISEIGFVHAEGVYFYKNNENGILAPVLVEYDSNGEINIRETNERVYLSQENGNPKNLLGYMNNVKIKKQGSNNVVEFKKGGFLARFPEQSPPDKYEYSNIKESGKIYFSDKGGIIKAEFESSLKNVFYLNNQGYDVPANGEFKFENGELTLKLKNGGSFSYFKEKEPDKKKNYNNIKPGGEFKFNNKGEIIKAKFEVDKKIEVEVKGYSYELPENGGIDFDGTKADIILPDGTKLEYPKKLDNADSNFVFSFRTKSGGAIELPNGDFFEVKGKETIVYNKNGEFYFTDQNAIIKKSGKEDLYLYNPGGEVYLFFNEDKIDKTKSSVFLGEDKIILTSLNGKGAAVSFAEDNRIGLKVTPKNTDTAQAINGRVFIEKGKDGEIPNIKISGESIAILDKRSFYGKEGQLYFNPKAELIGDFNYGRYDASVKLSLADNDGNNLRKTDIFSNGKDQYAAVNSQKFKSSLEFFKTKGDFYVSPKVAFNQLTPAAQKFYAGLDSAQQNKLAAFAGNGEKENAGLFQRKINQIMVEEENRRRNPILASVRIPTGGGSGTIIGVDKQGYPIVLSCGHLYGQTYPGGGQTIQTADGKQYDATVIGAVKDWRGGTDASLLRIDQQVSKIPYIPVASESLSINQGDVALRIGCPGCGQFKQTPTRIGNIGYTIGATDYIYGGESGGGLFYKGRVIGIVSTDGYYTGTNTIRQFVRENGYGYLIKISMTIIRFKY